MEIEFTTDKIVNGNEYRKGMRFVCPPFQQGLAKRLVQQQICRFVSAPEPNTKKTTKQRKRAERERARTK